MTSVPASRVAQTDAFRSRTPSPAPSTVLSKAHHMLADVVPRVPPLRSFNNGLILLYVCLAFWLGWLILPLHELDDNGRFTHEATTAGLHNYFGNFEGFSECNIRAAELYAVPPRDHLGFYDFGTFCHDRKHLLKALSEGGRVGFDAPYTSRGMY